MSNRTDGGRLAGRVAWVTGSSRGIGRGIAQHLAALGAQVAIHGTTPTSTRAYGEGESLEAVRAEIAAKTGGEILAVHGDLTRDECVQELYGQVRARFGRIDILVNNAGGDIGVQGTFAADGGKPRQNDAINVSVEDIRTVFDRNWLTCILPCRAVAPEMIARKQGWIVNMGSVAGLRGHPREVVYGCAKAAVHLYTRCLAAQLREHGVFANAIAPGEIVTGRFLASRATDDARKVHDASLTRYGWPEEVARVVEFLVTSDSSYVSGQILKVDGGALPIPT